MPEQTFAKRLSDIEDVVADLPAILNVRFDHAAAERAEIRADVASLKTALSDLHAEVKALPRAVAELLRDIDD